MRKFNIVWLCTLLLSGLCKAHAADEQAITSQTQSLGAFMLRNEAMTLHNASGQYDISFPIADRVKPLTARLNLVLTNSNMLKNSRSQLVVYVNDFIVGQIKLDPVNNNTEVQLPIEPELLKPGYNSVSFRAAQHYTDSECEDWSAPELWTTINTVKSTLTLNYQAQPVTEKLSALQTLINDHLPKYALTVVRGESTVSDPYLYWGAMIAQAVKLRLKYVPLQLDEHYLPPAGNEPQEPGRFNFDPEALKNDAVLVGNKQQIAKLLPDAIRQDITGPYLAIYRQDEHPERFILVISGQDDAEVKTAVAAFASLNMPYPDQQAAIVKQVDIPAHNALSSHELLPGNTYRFSDLGYAPSTFDSVNSQGTLQFRLPADIYATEDSLVELNLNLAYGAAMRSDSVINFNLNDTFVHAVRLKEIDGAHYSNYQIRLPLRSFKTGLNTLSFRALMTPLESGSCLINQSRNLIAQIYADSSITLPQAGRLAILPDLALLKRTGYPFVKSGSAADTTFRLLDTSSDTIAAAWLVIANLAAHGQTPVFDVAISQAAGAAKPHTLVIGKVEAGQQADALFQQAPVKLDAVSRFPHGYQQRQIAPDEALLTRIERLLFDGADTPEPMRLENQNIRIDQVAGLGGQYLAMSYPTSKGDGVMLAMLSDAKTPLYPGVEKLFAAGLWGQMQGNVFIWDKNGRFQWLQEGGSITLGDDLRLNLIGHFSKYPWQWLSLVVGLLVLVAWITHKLLTKYQQTVH